MKQLGSALLFLTVTITSLTSCKKEVIGEGPVVTETRNVENFSGIDMRMSGNVYYTQGTDYKVEVRAQQNVINVLETYVSNDKLVIKIENDTRVRRREDITVNVTAPDLNSLRLSGSGNITTNGLLTSDNMNMDVSGSGSIRVSDIDANYLEATISGSGDINVLDGVADEEKLKISGSGNIDLSNVAAKKVTTTTSGSGNTSVMVSDQLDVTISGSGSVFYKGQPIINTKIAGSGKVKHL